VKHNKVIHRTSIFLIVTTEESPYVEEKDRLIAEQLGGGFHRMFIRYGFMESPNVPAVLDSNRENIKFTSNEVTYFFGRETLIATDKPGMARWREHLFAFMSTNALRATAFYNIPAEQVIEIGFQIEL
jgi:KUP system potassium uptake protein